uniref:NADH-quinone oxidoreductase subunit I n=1 Tax=Meloidogyne hapla TaxID=6305 RepID=A0A1I8BJM0_MELHA
MKTTPLLNRHTMSPFYTYKELIPLAGKNLVPNASERPRPKK